MIKAILILSTLFALGSGTWQRGHIAPRPGAHSPEKDAEQVVEVPVPVQYALLSKVVGYDRNFSTRVTAPKVVVGILYQEKNLNSLSVKDAFLKELTAGAIKEIGGKPVSYKLINVDKGLTDLLSLKSGDVQVLIITPLKGVDIASISNVSRKLDILSFSSLAGYCDKGTTLGVELVGGKTQLVVNLPASKEEGCDFSSQLLKVSRIIN